MKHLQTFGMALALLISAQVHAEAPEDEFVRIYNLIQQADSLAERGQSKAADQKYLEAQEGLQSLQKNHPDWNEKVIQFRLRYVAGKLKPIPAQEKPAAPVPVDAAAVPPESAPDFSNLIPLMREQIRQLTAEKEVLQARLREALSARPAATDPRELAKAEEQNKSLRKEIELLKVNLQKAPAKPDKPVDPAFVEELQKGLASANQKLAQQHEMIAAAALEKEALQNQLKNYIDGAQTKALRDENALLQERTRALQARATVADKTKELQLESLQTDLAAYKTRQESMLNEKKTLEDRLRKLETVRETASIAKTQRAEQELAETRAMLATNVLMSLALRDALRLAREEEAEVESEKRALEIRLADAQKALVTARSTAGDSPKPGQAERDLRRLLSSDSQDAVSLLLLGVVKVRERKFDEALAALSRSAELDPQNAETFQYLGVTLAEKGLRAPAESAFRRATQLNPANGEAHHQLALIYATQRPPATELARRHYQQAIEAGHSKNSELEKMLKDSKAAAVPK